MFISSLMSTVHTTVYKKCEIIIIIIKTLGALVILFNSICTTRLPYHETFYKNLLFPISFNSSFNSLNVSLNNIKWVCSASWVHYEFM